MSKYHGQSLWSDDLINDEQIRHLQKLLWRERQAQTWQEKWQCQQIYGWLLNDW